MIPTILSLLFSINLAHADENPRDQAMRAAQKVEKDVGHELKKARDGVRRLVNKKDDSKDKKVEEKKSED